MVAGAAKKAEVTIIEIASFSLVWSEWYAWHRFIPDARSDPRGVRVPNRPGVYEVRLHRSNRRLTIGKASNLRSRIKQGLVKGATAHSTGKRIRANERTDRIRIRWAETDRPACAEEELHKRYKKEHGMLPKYTKQT